MCATKNARGGKKVDVWFQTGFIRVGAHVKERNRWALPGGSRATLTVLAKRLFDTIPSEEVLITLVVRNPRGRVVREVRRFFCFEHKSHRSTDYCRVLEKRLDRVGLRSRGLLDEPEEERFTLYDLIGSL